MTGRSAQREVVLDWVANVVTGLQIGHPVRVAVDGITAAGKTTFADEVAARIRARGRTCARVTMDGFHRPRAVRHRKGRESADGYYEDAYDFAALRTELLEPLGPTGDRRYRTAIIDLASDTPIAAGHEVADDDLVLIVDGSFLHRGDLRTVFDLTVFLRADFDAARSRGAQRDATLLGSLAEAERIFRVRYHAAQQRYLAEEAPERAATIVIAHHDPQAPTVLTDQRLRPSDRDHQVEQARSFFAPRAPAWNERFAEDAPSFVRAVAEMDLGAGHAVLDVGCGAGRAIPDVHRAVGDHGLVVGVDVTPEMLSAARETTASGSLVTADAQSLPFRSTTFDAIFAAGLVSHLADPFTGLVEFARLTRPGARLGIFHPVGRARLAEKHGRGVSPDDPLDPTTLPALLAATGWSLASVDDGRDRYLALADRHDSTTTTAPHDS